MSRSRSYALERRRASTLYRQKFMWGVLPVPGREAQNPPLNHHGVDLPLIRRMLELNRASAREGYVLFPGLGVSKHPMTVATSVATYVIGWASSRGVRSISMVGGPPLPDGRILFLEMGQPMVFTSAGGMICVTPPVVFIGRRVYNQVTAPETTGEVQLKEYCEERELVHEVTSAAAQTAA